MIRDAANARSIRRITVTAVLTAACCTATVAGAQTCDPTTSAVGAHLSHTRDSFARAALSCIECHAPQCIPNQAGNVMFGTVASLNGAQPAWNPAARTCSGVYCHGSTLGNSAAVVWSYVDPALVRPPSERCTICHGYPPAPPHEQSTNCGSCHPAVGADGSIDVADGRHLNGTLEATGCTGCHGNPPATGAHVAHYGLAGGGTYGDLSTLEARSSGATPTDAPRVYAFGCGNCHPTSPTHHRNGVMEVVLHEPGVASGTLKGNAAATASYDAATGTCSGVYCHSTGQTAPAYVTTPGWFSGDKVGCAGCHANPPAYPSGGPGAATANSHLDLADDGYEFGHFLGMPGPWHTSKHGGGGWGVGQDAAPITCQTCHYDTTDPANTGASGFYYLDTTGNYALPGGDPGRIDWGWQASIQCGYCHTAGAAGTGMGKVLPLRHVNGARDVVFDPRTTLPPVAWLPAPPNAPAAPYWVTDAGLAGYWPSSVSWSGTTVTFGLDTSTYDPATKTCRNVACHVAQQEPVWGTPYQYDTNGSATCYTCHPL